MSNLNNAEPIYINNQYKELVQLLLSTNRIEDIDKATKDRAYCKQLMQEFQIE